MKETAHRNNSVLNGVQRRTAVWNELDKHKLLLLNY
jgi:hypothetical protein